MKTNMIKTLTCIIGVAALCIMANGQSIAVDTNAPLVISATDSTGTDENMKSVEVSPEVRAEMIESAAKEIGSPKPGDVDDLLARHDTLAKQMLAIQQRHDQGSTNAPTTQSTSLASSLAAPNLAVSSGPAVGTVMGVKDQSSQPSEQLGHIIGELSEIQSQLAQKQPSRDGR